MKTIWTKHKILIIILGYAAIVSAALYFIFLPLIFKIKDVSSQIQASSLDSLIMRERLEKLPQMDEDWAGYEAGRDSLEVLLSPDSEIGFIENIERIAENTSNAVILQIGNQQDAKELAKIKRSSAKDKDKEKGILDEVAYDSYFPIQMELKGNFENLFKFIHSIENMKFYVEIVSMDVKKSVVEEKGEKSNMFTKNAASPGDENENKKEILNTTINAIVYTKK